MQSTRELINSINRDNLIDVPLLRPTSHKLDKIKVGLANCQSVRKKTDEIIDYIIDYDIDIMTFTETWLKDDGSDQRTIGDLTPSGYCFKHVPRSGRVGGGVGVLYKHPLALQKLTAHRCKF